MSAATSDLNTSCRQGRVVSVPVAASTRIFAGTLVARNSLGLAVPASDTAGLRVVGIAVQAADNRRGQNGDGRVDVQKAVARLPISRTRPFDEARGEQSVYVEDDSTVAASSANKIVAGRLLEIDPQDPSMAWVDTYLTA